MGEYGPDIVIPAGGGMLGHPDGYMSGAMAWQQAIAAGQFDDGGGVIMPLLQRKDQFRPMEWRLGRGGVGGEMHFDYKMRPGVVPHSNALALMRAAGLEV